MTTKELLALVGKWRERGESLPTEGGRVYHIAADELAPIATALCAEVEALRKVAEAARRSLSQTAANQRDGLVPTVYYRAHQDLANALAAIDAAKEPK